MLCALQFNRKMSCPRASHSVTISFDPQKLLIYFEKTKNIYAVFWERDLLSKKLFLFLSFCKHHRRHIFLDVF